jgi:amino acid transporter
MSTPMSRIGELRHGILGLRDAFSQSLALLALAFASSVATSAAAANAGAAAPWAYIIAGAGSLCLASVIIRFTRRMATAGGIYTYTARGLNPSGGFIAGWLYSWAFAAGLSFVMTVSALFMSTTLTAHTSIDIGWFPWFFIMMGALALVAFLDIRISTRTQLVIAVLSVGAILLLLFIILGKGGDSGITLDPFDPTRLPNTHGVFLAAVFAFTGFIGFEAAAVLGEETAEPLKAIPKAILTAVLVALVYYLFLTWVMSVGFGVGNAGKWASDPAALDTLATRYAGTWLAVLVDLAVAVSGLVAGLAGLQLTARTMYAMGREGGLPSALAWTHPRFRSPWVAIAGTLLLTIGLVVWLPKYTYDPFTYFAFMATTASLGILFAYILVSLAGMVYFWRARSGDVAYNVLLDIVLPLGSIAICGYTIYKSVFPRPPAPISFAPYIAGGWFAVGVAILLWLYLRSPERIARFGSILGEVETPAPAPRPPETGAAAPA